MTKAKKAAKPETTIKAIKGFDKDLRCRGFQFDVGKTYEQTGKIICCENGFHAVTGSPLDIWNYYPIIGEDGSLNRWADVTLAGETGVQDGANDSKIAAAKITIDVEINLPAFIKRAVAWMIDATKDGGVDTGDYSQLAASGDYSKLAASGHYSQLAASGDSSQLAASGDYSKLAASGHYSQLAASGHSSQLAASSHYSKLAASGYYSKLAASGHYSKLAASGHYSQLAASGHYSVVATTGPGSTVSGADGTHIAIAAFDGDGKPIGFVVGCIGRDGLLPNVAYRADGLKLVAA
jgi:hypothetical protein